MRPRWKYVFIHMSRCQWKEHNVQQTNNNVKHKPIVDGYDIFFSFGIFKEIFVYFVLTFFQFVRIISKRYDRNYEAFERLLPVLIVPVRVLITLLIRLLYLRSLRLRHCVRSCERNHIIKTKRINGNWIESKCVIRSANTNRKMFTCII